MRLRLPALRVPWRLPPLRRPAWLGGPGATPPAPRPLPAVQAWLPVRDVADGVMVRADGCPVAAVRVLPAALGLLSEGERQRRIAGLHEAIQGLGARVQLVTLPRPIDLDGHLGDLRGRLGAATGPRRELLAGYARCVRTLAGGGEALEHRHYVLIPGGPGCGSEELRLRATEFASALGRAELAAHLCEEAEVLDLLFSFLHPLHAALERAAPPVAAPRLMPETPAPQLAAREQQLEAIGDGDR